MNTNNRLEEPLLTEDNSRFTQLPLKYPLLQKAFEQHESMFWSAKEIDYSADLNDRLVRNIFCLAFMILKTNFVN